MPATIFAGTRVKALKSTLNLNGGADIISSSVDPTSSATEGEPGSLLLNTTSGKLYRKNDSGSSTNWSEVGSGGSGINYVTNPTAATNTTGWSTYADAAGTQPVDGTGGSPTVTWTRSTTTPLRGAGDFNFTKDAANRQGEGVATDITIDLADQAKVLTVSFDYEVLSGTYATGDLTVYLIADPSGTPIVIQPAGYQIQSGTAGTKLKQIATFQTQATGQSYRVCFHVASTSASAYSLAVDNVVVGPQTVQYGAPVTDWDKYYTPVITGSISNPALGTNTNIAKYRRVGDSLEIEWFFNQSTAGTTGSGTYYVSLPPGLSIDPSKLSSTAGGAAPMLGSATLFNNTNRGSMFVLYQDSTHFFLSGLYQAGEGEWGSGFYSLNNTTLYVRARVVVPILGWSSTVQMSNDTDTRVVAFSGYTSATTAFSGVITKVAMTSVADSHAGWSADTYTVPVSGYYKIVASLPVYSPATGNGFARIYIDSTSVNTTYQAVGVVGGTSLLALDWEQFLTAGQQISVRINNSSGSMSLLGSVVGAVATLTINRLSGPSAIAATETVAANYACAAGQSITPASQDTMYPFTNLTTKYKDTHGAFNPATGTFTAPISGTYRVSGSMITPPGTATYRTGFGVNSTSGFSVISPLVVNTSTQTALPCTWQVNLNAGQTVTFGGSSSSTLTQTWGAADGRVGWFTIERVGN